MKVDLYCHLSYQYCDESRKISVNNNHWAASHFRIIRSPSSVILRILFTLFPVIHFTPLFFTNLSIYFKIEKNISCIEYKSWLVLLLTLLTLFKKQYFCYRRYKLVSLKRYVIYYSNQFVRISLVHYRLQLFSIHAIKQNCFSSVLEWCPLIILKLEGKGGSLWSNYLIIKNYNAILKALNWFY